jgi:hypothetical protein
VILLQVAVAEKLLAAQLHSGLACRHIWAAQAVQVTYMHMQQVSTLSQRHANNDSLDPVLPLTMMIATVSAAYSLCWPVPYSRPCDC